MKIAIDLQGIQSKGSRSRGIGRYSLEIVRNIIDKSKNHDIYLVSNPILQDVKFEFLPDKKLLKYSFLLLSNNNNKKNIGSFSLYYDVPSSNSNNLENKKKIKISNNKINFKNYMQISGSTRINEGADIRTLFIDVKCNGKIYNHVQIIK